MDDDVIHIKDQKFGTLIAVTPEEHVTGLMYKPWPPPVMCFPYNRAEVRKFWMKNCPSALDIVFCKDSKIISVVYGEPMSTKLIGPELPSDLVIELPHGTAAKHEFSVGDPVRLCYSTKTIARDIRNSFEKILK